MSQLELIKKYVDAKVAYETVEDEALLRVKRALESELLSVECALIDAIEAERMSNNPNWAAERDEGVTDEQ